MEVLEPPLVQGPTRTCDVAVDEFRCLSLYLYTIERSFCLRAASLYIP